VKTTVEIPDDLFKRRIERIIEEEFEQIEPEDRLVVANRSVLFGSSFQTPARLPAGLDKRTLPLEMPLH
jgi:hypothetical protein